MLEKIETPVVGRDLPITDSEHHLTEVKNSRLESMKKKLTPGKINIKNIQATG